jgi:hypothetical protein
VDAPERAKTCGFGIVKILLAALQEKPVLSAGYRVKSMREIGAPPL